MTLALIAALIATVAAFVWLLDRKDARTHTEREKHAWQVADLCQRIQAPEIAVAAHDVESGVMLQPPDADDDEAFWQQRKDAVEEIERMEREQREFEARLA